MILVVQRRALVNELLDRPQRCRHIGGSSFVLARIVILTVNITCGSAVERKLFEMVLRGFGWVIAPGLVPPLPWNHSLVDTERSAHFEMRSTKPVTLMHQIINLPEAIVSIPASGLFS